MESYGLTNSPNTGMQDFGHYKGMYLDTCKYLFNAAGKHFITSRLRLWFTLTRLAVLNILYQRLKKDYRLAMILGFPVLVGDIRIAYKIFIDLFIRGDYHFCSDAQKPLIVDGGSHIGLSILYFKLLYPGAEIIGFEPNPLNFKLLTSNISRWGFQQVCGHNLALSDRQGYAEFVAASTEGDWGGHVRWNEQGNRMHVSTGPLSSFLCRNVDLLKLDIEGEEEKVITELYKSGKLARVRRIIIEFHHAPHLPYSYNSLSQILGVLEKSGFNYYLSSSDEAYELAWATGGQREVVEDRYQQLIYASQSDSP